MLLKFDVSKAVDPTQPFASFLMSLLTPVDLPSTTDIVFRLESDMNQDPSFSLHRFVLAARSEYFRQNLESRWKGKKSVRFSSLVHPRSIESIIKYLYSGECLDPGKEYRDNLRTVVESLRLPSELLQIVDTAGLPPGPSIRDLKRIEMNRVQSDFENFVQGILTRQVSIENNSLEIMRKQMSLENPVWADCLLYINTQDSKSALFYAHLSILTRSEYFFTMFTAPFSESRTIFGKQEVLPLIRLPIEVEVAPIVLTFLYTDRAEIPREMALEVLYAADFLLLPRLKSLATIALESDIDPLNELPREDLYEVLKAAWATNTPRLEYILFSY
jgi:ankyrin repeat and BTB/POZ domain-containing protein 1